MRTVILLTISNLFMTIAWYGHLKFQGAPLWKAIAASWLIAFVEYCFQVPANRLGAQQFSLVQLKTLQEVITLVVFIGFALVAFPDQRIRWNHLVAFGLIIAAVFFAYVGRGEAVKGAPAAASVEQRHEGT